VAPFQHGLSHLGKTQAQQAAKDVIQLLSSTSTTTTTTSSTTSSTLKTEQQYHQLIILTSDFLRAKETAQIVADYIVTTEPQLANTKFPLGKPIIETRLRERWFGDWDGGPDNHYPDVWKHDLLDSNHTLCAVESVQSVLKRTIDCVMEWDASVSTKNTNTNTNTLILLVAHGDVLQIVQTAFARMDCAHHRSLPHLETATLRPLELK